MTMTAKILQHQQSQGHGNLREEKTAMTTAMIRKKKRQSGDIHSNSNMNPSTN
jgi:hypothetical protein